MRIRRATESDEIGVHMAPLIDVVFLLLIFFLVAATLKEVYKQIPIDLPRADYSQDAKAVEDALVIQVDSKGKIFVGNDEMTANALEMAVLQALDEMPDGRVRIEADKRTSVQHLTYVLSIVQARGAKKVGFQVQHQQAL